MSETAYYRRRPKGMIFRNGEYRPDPQNIFHSHATTVTQWNAENPSDPSAHFRHVAALPPPPLLHAPGIAPLPPPPLPQKQRPVLRGRRSVEATNISVVRELLQLPNILHEETLPEVFRPAPRPERLDNPPPPSVPSTPCTPSTPSVNPEAPVKSRPAKTDLLKNPPLLRLLGEILRNERQEQPQPYTCPLDTLAHLSERTDLTRAEKQELVVLTEAHEMLLWVLVDRHMTAVHPGKKYIEGELLSREYIAFLYASQHHLLHPVRGHQCFVRTCPNALCMEKANGPLPGCRQCGCNFYGPTKQRFYLRPPPDGGQVAVKIDKVKTHPGPPGYHSEVVERYMPATGLVFVCRLTGRIHLCGPYCVGGLDEDAGEFVCRISGEFKGKFAPKVIPIMQKDVYREIVRGEGGAAASAAAAASSSSSMEISNAEDASDAEGLPCLPVANPEAVVMDMSSLGAAMGNSPSLSFATLSSQFSLDAIFHSRDNTERRNRPQVMVTDMVSMSLIADSMEIRRRQSSSGVDSSSSGELLGGGILQPPPPLTATQKQVVLSRRQRKKDLMKIEGAPPPRPPKPIQVKIPMLRREDIRHLISGAMFDGHAYLRQLKEDIRGRLRAVHDALRIREVRALFGQPFRLEVALRHHVHDLDWVLRFAIGIEELGPRFFIDAWKAAAERYQQVVIEVYAAVMRRDHSVLTEKLQRHQMFVLYLLYCIHRTTVIRRAHMTFNTSMLNPAKLTVDTGSVYARDTNGFGFMEDLGYPRVLAGFHRITVL